MHDLRQGDASNPTFHGQAMRKREGATGTPPAYKRDVPLLLIGVASKELQCQPKFGDRSFGPSAGMSMHA